MTAAACHFFTIFSLLSLYIFFLLWLNKGVIKKRETNFKKVLGVLLAVYFYGIGGFLCSLDPRLDINQYNLEMYTT